MSRAHSYSHSRAHSPTSPWLHLCYNSFSNPSVALHTSQIILQPSCCFTYVTVHSPTLPPLYLCHSSFYSPSVASPTSQALHVLHLASCPCIGWWKNSLWWTSLLQQVTKFRSSYSFGWLLRILLLAVNLFSFSHVVSSDSSFNIHNALYFVKYPSRAAQNSPEGGPWVEDPWSNLTSYTPSKSNPVSG